jgi:pyruvate kinase
MRKTKIVATLGPATSDPAIIDELVESGMDVARLNFSHGTADEHRKNIELVREAAERRDRAVACLQDLSGPKIRTGKIVQPGGVKLEAGSRFVVTINDVAGDADRVSTTYKGLPKDVGKGDKIVLDDGRIALHVESVTDEEIVTEVVNGGILKSSKGINIPGVFISTPSLTDKDRRDVLVGLEMDVDFMAMSFVQRKEDIEDLRQHLRDNGREDLHIIAKIERPKAVENLSEILSVADAVMVARGDLGVELPPETVPTIQKQIIREANQHGTPVITATQMLESMVHEPVPTRAEASDVANAILDGTDALMLSAETASGSFPLEALQTMGRIAEHIEKHIGSGPSRRRAADFPFMQGSDVARAVALAARRAADEVDARFIVAFTESGSTVRLVSHSRPKSHILGFTPSERVYRRLAMRWGVTPVRGEHFDTTDAMLEVAMKFLKRKKYVEIGDIVVTVCGHTTLAGATNMMKVYKF